MAEDSSRPMPRGASKAAWRRFLALSFGPTKHASRIVSLWPVLLFILGALLPVIGLSVPHDVQDRIEPAWWIVAGLLILAGLLIRAGYVQARELVLRDTPVIRAEFAGGRFTGYLVGTLPHYGKYFHIRVTASEPARAVGGCVTAIRTWVGDDLREERLLSSIPLGWVRHPDALRIDLRPGAPEHLTVLLDQSHQPQVLFSTDSYEPQGVPFSLPTGRHEIDVLIDSDDQVPPVKLTLNVDAPGYWDGLNVWLYGEPEPPNQLHIEPPTTPSSVAGPTSGTIPGGPFPPGPNAGATGPTGP